MALGDWVLAEALEQAQYWREQVPGCEDLWISVNVSPRQLRSGVLPATLSAILARTGFPPEAACLEITESALMGEAGPYLDAMRALRAHGVHLAIDDFGTGYSSLAYLKTLPVTIVKIDRSFVEDLGAADRRHPPSSRPLWE